MFVNIFPFYFRGNYKKYAFRNNIYLDRYGAILVWERNEFMLGIVFLTKLLECTCCVVTNNINSVLVDTSYLRLYMVGIKGVLEVWRKASWKIKSRLCFPRWKGSKETKMTFWQDFTKAVKGKQHWDRGTALELGNIITQTTHQLFGNKHAALT